MSDRRHVINHLTVSSRRGHICVAINTPISTRLPILHYVQGNAICNVAGLNRCRTLVEVNLDGNKIRQLGPPNALHGLGSLRKLRLEDNGLRTLSAGLGASTPALLSLSLAQNRLSDPAEIDRLGALPNLMELSLGGNPMARRGKITED